jgi:hypothetical protein
MRTTRDQLLEKTPACTNSFLLFTVLWDVLMFFLGPLFMMLITPFYGLFWLMHNCRDRGSRDFHYNPDTQFIWFARRYLWNTTRIMWKRGLPFGVCWIFMPLAPVLDWFSMIAYVFVMALWFPVSIALFFFINLCNCCNVNRQAYQQQLQTSGPASLDHVPSELSVPITLRTYNGFLNLAVNPCAVLEKFDLGDEPQVLIASGPNFYKECSKQTWAFRGPWAFRVTRTCLRDPAPSLSILGLPFALFCDLLYLMIYLCFVALWAPVGIIGWIACCCGEFYAIRCPHGFLNCIFNFRVCCNRCQHMGDGTHVI